MKRIVICLFAACIISCSGENENTSPTTQANLKTGDVQPANSDNPYEDVGQLFIDIFDTYYDGSVLPTTISGISQRVETIAAQNTRFNALKGSTYVPATHSRIDYINSHPATCVQDVVNGLQLSSAAKTSLSQFINSVCDLTSQNNEYNTVYAYITAYETNVLADTAMTSQDKQVILCTTSICRYSAYKQIKKPKRNTDPEWALIITHVTAGSDGANTNICQSVTESLTSGIAANQ